jgi:hypothetical protein
VPENTALASPVYTVVASDEDVTDSILLSIISGNVNNGTGAATPPAAFSLGPSSGIVTVASALNYESVRQFGCGPRRDL